MRLGRRKGAVLKVFLREGRRLMVAALSILLFAAAINLAVPAAALATSESLEITGDGVTDPVTLTREELEEMEQHQYLYSSINTWPTKKWYVGRGVKLWDLLVEAGLKEDEAKLLKFYSTDGYIVTLTFKELFQDRRYCFPNFMRGSSEGHLPGDPSGAVEVEPIVALVSVEGSDNPEYMNELHTPMLMLGQRAVTEQTGNLFVKYLCKIEVLTAEPEKWDPPQANPPGGSVPAGTMVTLSNLHSDDDKIYYTTDGSIPTLNSPMYNWIASRWWSNRADVLGKINRPIGPLYEDATIKAITIGPGKLDSDVVTFTYKVVGSPDGPSPRVVKLTVGRMEASIDGFPYTLDAAPYIDAKAGRTLVPVRFIGEALGAGCDWNDETRQVIITAAGTVVVLTPGFNEVQVNGVRQTIDCASVILPPGRTFVPIRFVSETLGAHVDYDEVTKVITITR